MAEGSVPVNDSGTADDATADSQAKDQVSISPPGWVRNTARSSDGVVVRVLTAHDDDIAPGSAGRWRRAEHDYARIAEAVVRHLTGDTT